MASQQHPVVSLQVLIRAEQLPHVSSSSSNSNTFSPRTTRRKTRRPNAYAVLSDVSELGRVLGIKKDEIGRTEVIPHCDSPEWATVLSLRHVRCTQHRIAVDIFHQHDDQKSQSPKQICGLLLDVETILSSRDSMMEESIPGSSKGKLCVCLEESHATTIHQFTHLRLQLRGFRLHNTRKFVLERPDFLYEIRRKQRGHTQDSWALVFRSSIIPTTLNPLFEKEFLDLSILCNYDLDRELQITLVDCNDENYVVLGSTRVTVQTLLEQRSEQGNCDRDKALEIRKGMNDYYSYRSSFLNLGKLVVVHAELVGVKNSITTSNYNNNVVVTSSSTSMNGSNSGPIMAQAVQIMPPPSFSFDDYFQSNSNAARLELCVAIDFSAKETHISSPGYLNDYEWIMTQLGQAVSQYTNSSTPQFPVWGFGARFSGKLYPIFQVGPSSRATGASGLLEYYRSVFQTPEFEFGDDEPLYDNVIQAAAHFSKKQLDGAQLHGGISYTMLLVLTTGSDEQILRAREKLESVQSAPLSVVFVRMNNNSSRSDVGKLDSTWNRNGIRPFCTFLDGESFCTRNSVALVEASIGRVKQQLSDYFAARGAFPTTTR